LITLAISSSFAAGKGTGLTNWHKSSLPHFQVFTENTWKPAGFDLGLERIHRRLRFDLAAFTPWITKEQVKLYLYKDQKTYADGEFEPPPWSNGIAMYETRTLALFEQTTDKKLLEIIGHETTHLLFESFWAEKGKEPPAWLNEGLAMGEEVDSDYHPEASDWYRAMTNLPGQTLPLDEFFKITPTKDLATSKDKDEVGIFYAQAYSIVFFLFRTHPKLQFVEFCTKLRDGTPLQEALWQSYRIRDMKSFQKQWLGWLNQPSHRRKVDAALQAEAAAAAAGAAAPDNDRHKIRGLKEGFQNNVR